MKTIEIESCEGDCPFYNLGDSEHVDSCDLDGGLLTGEIGTIPDWCPLDDGNKVEHHLKNLLAVIHRDGGHYTEEHGIEKSVKDATQIVADAIVK